MNNQYNWFENNIAQLYFKLKRAKLCRNFSSLLTDTSDIHRFPTLHMVKAHLVPLAGGAILDGCIISRGAVKGLLWKGVLWRNPPPVGQEAGSTHSTGMHSSVYFYFEIPISASSANKMCEQDQIFKWVSQKCSIVLSGFYLAQKTQCRCHTCSF